MSRRRPPRPSRHRAAPRPSGTRRPVRAGARSRCGQAAPGPTRPARRAGRPSGPGRQPRSPGSQPSGPGRQPRSPGSQPSGPGRQPRSPGSRRQDRNRQDQGGNRDQVPTSNRDDQGDDRGSRRRRGRDRFRDRKDRQRGGRRTTTPSSRSARTTSSCPVAGILDVMENYAFVRTSGYLPGHNDVYVSLSMVRKNGLRKGDAITGATKAPAGGRAQGEVHPARPHRHRQRRSARGGPQPARVLQADAALPAGPPAPGDDARQPHHPRHRPRRPDRQGPARPHRLARPRPARPWCCSRSPTPS